MKKLNMKKLVYAGVCLAICMILPFFTGQIPQIGSALSPMHIPVLLCGFICGWPYGLVVGLAAPALRFILFGMPPLFPVGAAMTFELASYGLFTGILYSKLPKTVPGIYVSLITAMIAGRLVWGSVMAVIAGVSDVSFSFQAFIAGALLHAIPGIICHIVMVPFLVILLKKAHVIHHENMV